MDQLDGPGGDHAVLRAELVAHMRLARTLYEPFVEDDESFDTYCDRMARDGAWAGQIEVQALVRVRGVGVCIHQAGSPPWLIEPEAAESRGLYLHVSYHDQEHYNSVRCAKGSDAGGPGGPKPLPGEAPGTPAHEDAGATTEAEEADDASSSPRALLAVQLPAAVPAAKLSARERVEAKRAAKAAKAAARQRLAAGPRAGTGDGGDDALAAPLAALRL